MDELRPGPEASDARKRAYEVIFEHRTPAGRAFDIGLILAILASVGAVVLESVVTIRADHGPLLRTVEWGFTLLFSGHHFIQYGEQAVEQLESEFQRSQENPAA